jgi:glutamate-1-semialdehyde 2,1-aminomutase
MEQIAPLGPIYQAGTLSGNPVAMAAGLTTLNLISQPGFFDNLGQRVSQLLDGLRERASAASIPLTTNQAGGMFGYFFSDEECITRFDQVSNCDMDRFKRFYHGMLDAGIYLAPAAFEAGFVSGAHTEQDINATLDAAERVFATL